MTTLPYRERSYLRFVSARTGETLFEITMLEGSITVWGSHYRPSEFSACLSADGLTVSLAGSLSDRIGVVVTFDECLRITAGFHVECGPLPEDYNPSWSRDRS